jgi:pimeloyl-ACP methyl ester carboxylesterase
VLLALYMLAALAGLTVLVCLGLWAVLVPRVVAVFGRTPILCAVTPPAIRDGEECKLRTSDGLMLRGTYLRTMLPERLGVIAFCHELTANRWSAVSYLEQLRRDGYDVFTFDFRNHGASDRLRGYQPLPWVTYFELADVRAVIDYLASRPDADSRGIGLVGVSKGGTAALCAAVRDRRVVCVAADSAFATEAVQLHFFRRYIEALSPAWKLAIARRMPDRALAMLALWARLVVGLRMRCRFVNVGLSLRRLTRPVMLVHGERDSMIPLDVARALRGSLGGPSKLWIVPRAKHNGAIVVARGEYERRLARFFGRRLADTRPRRSARAPMVDRARDHGEAVAAS